MLEKNANQFCSSISYKIQNLLIVIHHNINQKKVFVIKTHNFDIINKIIIITFESLLYYDCYVIKNGFIA